MTEDFKYKDITGRIIGASMQVHSTLGNGFPSAAKGLPTARQEVIYQRALEIEFALISIEYNREFEMPIYYRGNHIGTRRVDIISVEIKAVIKLEDVHLAQAKNYLEAYNIEVGLLINFGSKSFEIKRLINSKFNPLKS